MLTPWSVTADAPARPAHPTSVRTLGTLACFASLLLLLFGRRGLELGGQWAADETYSHGFLVPLVSLFLAGRELARGWSGSGSPLGLVWVVLGCGARLAAAIVWFPPLDFVSLACLLHGLALLVGGSDLARRLRFPILFLFFACPLPAFLLDGLSVALQGLVASLAEGVLYQFVPVYREGYVLRLPGVVLEVGAACSGLRQGLAFLTLAALLAHLGRRSWTFTILLIASSLPVAIAANVVRVLLLAALGAGLGLSWVGGAYHTAWGLLTACLGLLGLLGVSWCLARLFPDRGEPEPAPTPTPVIAPRRTALVGAGLCLLLTAAAQLTLQSAADAAEPLADRELRQPLTAFPMGMMEWAGKDIAVFDPRERPEADEFLCREYVRDTPRGRLGCRVVMAHARDGRDRRHHPLVCYRAAGCPEVADERATLDDVGGSGAMTRFCFRVDQGHQRVYYWHYTLSAPEQLSPVRRMLARRSGLPSLTVEVFTDARTPEDLAAVDAFAREVERLLRQGHVPADAPCGSDTLLIRLDG